jgi:formate dehydrogenase assembly factor FdhD
MRIPLLICIGLLLSQAAVADIYKLVDENGRVTYSNVPIKGAKKLNLDPISTVSPPKPKAVTTPQGFPRVDNETQKKRDDTRRTILEQELAAEQKLLDEARKNLAEGEATRLGGERNYQKYLDRVQGLKDSVTLHEKNIEALNKELSGLR